MARSPALKRMRTIGGLPGPGGPQPLDGGHAHHHAPVPCRASSHRGICRQVPHPQRGCGRGALDARRHPGHKRHDLDFLLSEDRFGDVPRRRACAGSSRRDVQQARGRGLSRGSRAAACAYALPCSPRHRGAGPCGGCPGSLPVAGALFHRHVHDHGVEPVELANTYTDAGKRFSARPIPGPTFHELEFNHRKWQRPSPGRQSRSIRRSERGVGRMTSRERFLTGFHRQQPDMVPF